MPDTTPTLDGLLCPLVLEEAADFWAGCEAGELRVQRCDRCGRWRFPPSSMCAACGSFDRSWQATPGHGTVWSFAVPHPPLPPAYAAQAPFVVAVVALDEPFGIRMVGNLLERAGGDLREVQAATVRIGEAVRVAFQPRGALTVPQWVRQGTSEGGDRTPQGEN